MKTTKQTTIAISIWIPMSLTPKTIQITPARTMNERKICKIPIVSRTWAAAVAISAAVALIEEGIQMLAWTVITAIQMQYQWITMHRMFHRRRHQAKTFAKDRSFIIRYLNRVATAIFIVVVLVIITLNKTHRHPFIIIVSIARRTVSVTVVCASVNFLWNPNPKIFLFQMKVRLHHKWIILISGQSATISHWLRHCQRSAMYIVILIETVPHAQNHWIYAGMLAIEILQVQIRLKVIIHRIASSQVISNIIHKITINNNKFKPAHRMSVVSMVHYSIVFPTVINSTILIYKLLQ